MKTKFYSIYLIILLSLFLILFGCSNFMILPNGAYRPKHPNFDLVRLTSNYQMNPLINQEFLYLSTRKDILDYKPFSKKFDSLVAYYGFYSDGRLIKGTVKKRNSDSLLYQVNSYKNAGEIGYYISKNEILYYEYFAHSSDGKGFYYKGNGLIKEDTIISWYTDAGGLFKFDTLLCSTYRLSYD